MNGALLVAGGAAVGAPLRYLVDRAVRARRDPLLPWGTFAANVLGSVVLGLVTGAVQAHGASPQLQLLVGTGFCGALTTYSTFSYETLRLAESGARRLAAVNVAGSLAAGMAAVYAGTWLADLLL
ncbi:fluoride efflux transporter CrcB [Kitasatospora sp. NPDC058965]|uniref:fluoride efflux transporter CrcB n=1 Tax=Kitasatospora sp. NPDC058965 TaxID=3346682 RepID=UPI0036B2839B